MDQPAMESMSVTDAADAIENMLNGAIEEPEEVEETGEGESQETDEHEEADEAEETDEGEDAEPEEETEAPQIESLADLAEALDIPIEELQANLKTKIKVNGEELEVTLAELTQGYQKDADYRQKTSELSTQRKAFSEAYQMANQRLNQEFNQVGQLVQALEHFAVPALDPNEMAYLRQTDPATWLMRKSDHEEKVNQLQQYKTAASQAYQQHALQIQAQQEQQRTEILQKSLQDLPTRVADWSPQKKQALDEYLTSDKYGYSPEELAQIVDVRLIELVNKAYLYDTQVKKVTATKEKVKTLPKVLSPSKPVVKPKVNNIQKARARLAKTGHVNDAASAIANLL